MQDTDTSLLLEHQLFRQPLTLERARSLFRIDIAFGITAAAVLASGAARAILYGKGLDYYLKNSLFHAKIGLNQQIFQLFQRVIIQLALGK